MTHYTLTTNFTDELGNGPEHHKKILQYQVTEHNIGENSNQ